MTEFEAENVLESPEGHRPIEILLVEDNEADVKIALRVFTKAKLKNKISVVRDGQEALDFILHQDAYSDAQKFPRPDLILLDIQMPRRNGFEVLRDLKRDPRFDSIPVIMFTSSKNQEDVVRSFRGGAISFISKPISYDEFVKVVEGFNFYWHAISKLPRKNDAQ